MQTQSPAQQRDAEAQVGSDELAEGLMLVRASTLKMIRLQLAMERQDRRVALETVDDLVEIDRRLEDYLADVSAPLMFRRELEEERGAVNREKLTLAAGVIRRDPHTPEPKVEASDPVAAPAAEWSEFEFAPYEPERSYRTIKWFAVTLLVLSAAAWAAYMLVDPQPLTSFAAEIGALR
jgi:hypothetical protein